MSYLLLGINAASLAISLFALFSAKKAARRAGLSHVTEWNRSYSIGAAVVQKKRGAWVRTRTVSNAYMRRGRAVVDVMETDAVPLLGLRSAHN